MPKGLATIIVALVVGIAPAAQAATTTWTFSEADGSGVAYSNTGVAATLQTEPGFTGGARIAGGKLVLNGHGRAVVPESEADLDPGTASFAVSVRASTTVVPSDQVGDFDLARDGLSTHKRYWKVEFYPNSDNTKAFAFCQMRGYVSGVGHRGTKLVWRGKDLSDGIEHTITCSKTNSQVTLSVDGVVRLSRSVTIGNIYNSAAFAIGAKAEAWQDQHDGTIDDVSITS